tara:strand:- start:4102 stop:4989 length:888 start_codon:yes stop_codon:yes gene_type:complete
MAKHYQGSPATTTTDAVFIPEVWSEAIYKYFERKVIFRGLVDDYSPLVANGGDKINIPEIGILSASAKSAGSDVSFDATTATQTSLDLDQHYYVAKLFEDILLVQSNYQLIDKYSKMFGEALARQVDSYIWTTLQGLSNNMGLSADDTLTAGKFEDIIASMGNNGIDYMGGDVFMVVNPVLMADILNPSAGLSQFFIRNDASGDGSGLKTGNIGSLYGIDVFMSNAISSGGTASTISGAIFHRSAVAFAIQEDVRIQSEYSIDALGTKVVADSIYGAKLIDDSDNVKGIKFQNVA